MTKISVALAGAACAVAGSAAMADNSMLGTPILSGSQVHITASPLGSGAFNTRDSGVIYDSTPGPYVAASTVTGNMALTNGVFSSYASIGTDPANSITALHFVGGVAVANTSVFFGFFDPTGATLAGSFGVTLPQAGNFIWTITLNSPFPAIDNVGQIGLIPANGVTATFYESGTAPAVGTSQDVTNGHTGYYAYQISVPAPASAALLGLGGLVAARRRRA